MLGIDRSVTEAELEVVGSASVVIVLVEPGGKGM